MAYHLAAAGWRIPDASLAASSCSLVPVTSQPPQWKGLDRKMGDCPILQLRGHGFDGIGAAKCILDFNPIPLDILSLVRQLRDYS